MGEMKIENGKSIIVKYYRDYINVGCTYLQVFDKMQRHFNLIGVVLNIHSGLDMASFYSIKFYSSLENL